MKAVYFEKTGSEKNLSFGELPDPGNVPENFCRIEFISGSLNHLDLWVIRGLPKMKYQFPHIVGADLYGRVVESNSPQFKEGDLVVVYPAEASSEPENLSPDFEIRGESMSGVFCEQSVISDRYLFSAPKHLSEEEAGAIGLVFLTAWQMFSEKAGLLPVQDPEQAILVHGAGSGVSQALTQLLLSSGYKNIVLTSRSSEKLQEWEKQGVQTQLIEKTWDKALKEKTGGFSVVFDHVGVALFESNIRLLRNSGRFVTCGATSGFDARLDLRHLFFRQLQLLGSTMGSLQHFAEVLSFIEAHQIRPKLSHRFPLSEARKAYGLLAESKQNGKIVLKATH